jgi:hypothetical protein
MASSRTIAAVPPHQTCHAIAPLWQNVAASRWHTWWQGRIWA